MEEPTLFNGDCLKIMNDIPDASIDMILTDPPYGMKFQSGHREVKYEKIANDDDLSWMGEFVDSSFRVLKEDSALYAFCSWHNVDIFKQAIERKFTIKNIIIWEKNNTSMGDLQGSYAPKYEMVIYGVKGRKLLNGFRYPDILKAPRTGNNYHPTEKPVSLLKILLESSSKVGDVILDCFMGSGSTGVACLQTGRNFVGIELNSTYYNTAKKRIEEAKGNIQLSLF